MLDLGLSKEQLVFLTFLRVLGLLKSDTTKKRKMFCSKSTS